MKFLPDTGANITALDITHAKGIILEDTTVTLKVANGTYLKTLGTAEANFTMNGFTAPELIYIVEGLSEPLLSRRMLKALGLLPMTWPKVIRQEAVTNSVAEEANTGELRRPHEISYVSQAVKPVNTWKYSTSSVSDLVKEGLKSKQDNTGSAEGPSIFYAKLPPLVTAHGLQFDALANEFRQTVFSEVCTPMNGPPHSIKLKPGARPINTGASRKVPEPLLPAVKAELESQVKQGIIEPINQATEWLHPMVVVPKKGTGGIRICVDFRRINEHVIRPTNSQPTPWEVVRNLPKGINHYAVFDAFKGYHQVALDKESQLKTAFMTPFGRHVYKRLPMGLNSANDVFTLQYGNAVDESTDHKRATEDTLIYARSTAELITKTRKFFQACHENGITLNLKKVQWDAKEVTFAGFLLTDQGYEPDPSLAKALSEFPHPKSITDMRSFFGLAN